MVILVTTTYINESLVVHFGHIFNHNGIIVYTSVLQDLSKEIRETGGEKSGKLLALKCDVTKEEEIKEVFKKAQAEFGGVDVCVNNAGLAHNAPLLSGATSDWKNMLDVSY